MTYGRALLVDAGRQGDLAVNSLNALVTGTSRALTPAAVAEMRRAFEVDVAGPAALTEALLPALHRADHPVVLLVGSRMGDVTFNRSLPADVQPASYAYRIARDPAVVADQLLGGLDELRTVPTGSTVSMVEWTACERREQGTVSD